MIFSQVPLLFIALVGLAPTQSFEPSDRPAATALEIPFSSPSEKKRVEVTLYWGRMRIRPHSEDIVRIERNREDTERTATGGARVFRGGGPGFVASERANVVQVVADPPELSGVRNLDLVIWVPVASDLKLLMDRGGEIEVSGVSGALEVSSNNGSIVLDEVAGYASVDALNGSIKASFREVEENRAMSFSTMNGEIDVSLPRPLQADLRVSTIDDDIVCEFDLEEPRWTGDSLAEAASTKADDPDGHSSNRLLARIGGGGPLFFFSTHNGVVKIRRRAES